jgi:hypothetical protein
MLSLIKNNLGEYVAEEATKVANIPVDTSAYDAYSGTQKTSLATGTGAGSTDLGKQTEAIIQREDPSKQSLVFDAKTGTFKTQGDIKQDKQKVEFGKLPTTSDTTATGKTTDPLSVAQRIARMTPMANQSMGQLPDFESMMESMQPSIKDQVFSTALSAGKDIAIKYATQKVLGKTFAGQLAGSQVGLGGMSAGGMGALMTNPYTIAAAALFSKPGRKIVKKVFKGVKKVTKKATNLVKKIFSDIRLKTNIELIGKSPSNINIYQFNYIGSAIKYSGVMAHEVPWAVEKHESGYLMVDYNKVDVEFRRVN